MNKTAKIGQTAPLLKISEWVQGEATNLDSLIGQVVLIEVFQVNCPSCFLYSLPQVIELYHQYQTRGLTVIGIATAFEDFDKNTLNNLKLLVNENKVIGDAERYLLQNDFLQNGLLPYQIPFPLCMDQISQQDDMPTDDQIMQFIYQQKPDFEKLSDQQKTAFKQLVIHHLQSRLLLPETFKQYALQGTPSHIVIDKKGILKAVEFGQFNELEWLISNLLKE